VRPLGRALFCTALPVLLAPRQRALDCTLCATLFVSYIDIAGCLVALCTAPTFPLAIREAHGRMPSCNLSMPHQGCDVYALHPQ